LSSLAEWFSPDVDQHRACRLRKGEAWAVFVVKDGRAQTQMIKIGHRNSRTAEVLSGLGPGDPVGLHPSDRIADGTRVAARNGG
jgi:HlyD family secretion protein